MFLDQHKEMKIECYVMELGIHEIKCQLDTETIQASTCFRTGKFIFQTSLETGGGNNFTLSRPPGDIYI